MTYELWDADTGNALGTYDTEDAALQVVRATIKSNGREVVQSVGLLRVSARGRGELVAQGEDLVARALGTTRFEKAPTLA